MMKTTNLIAMEKITSIRKKKKKGLKRNLGMMMKTTKPKKKTK